MIDTVQHNNSAQRKIIPFDVNWRFSPGDEPDAARPAFDDTTWRTLDVPHDWSIEGGFSPPPSGDNNGGYFSHGIGWYRKTFALPQMPAQKVVVEFDGVYMNSEVWINGNFLGRRPYGFSSFRYDLTDYLKTDGTHNVIAVRVDDSLEPSVRWYAGAGIYRHVRLIITGYTHFSLDGGIAITTPEVAPGQAVVQADYTIDAHFFSESERQALLKNIVDPQPISRELVLCSIVLAPDGGIVGNVETNIVLKNMRPGQRATQRITVPAPGLWSDLTPALHCLRSTLMLDGRIIDETTTTFGIRKLDFNSDKGLLVNDRPVKLKGVCLHQDAGSFGNAVPAPVWAWRLAQLKKMGCNAVRPSHHPFAPEFYDLCDALGFYVLDEAFDEWNRDWPYNITADPRGKSKYGYHLYFNQWSETDLRAMLRRDRNHPSVILYSIGNEIPNQFDTDDAALAKRLVAICHEEDPTRPVTAGCDQYSAATRNGFMDALDIAGYNYIDRAYGERTYAPERERFPNRLCLGAETYYLVHNWLGVRDLNYVIGEFLWVGIDYLGESLKYPRRGWNAGLLDLAGGPKPEFHQRAAYWRDEPVLQLSVLTGDKPENIWYPVPSIAKWNWPAGAIVIVRAATNCDEVELLLNDRSLGRHPVLRDVYASDWTVPFEPGTLTAVGYSSGKRVADCVLRTAGSPASLEIIPLKSSISGNIALYDVTVVDADGLTVPDATLPVTMRVEGDGRLIGLDTGDISYCGAFKTDTRAAYQGRLLVTVQRTSPAGQVRLFAITPGLPASTLMEQSSAAAERNGAKDFSP